MRVYLKLPAPPKLMYGFKARTWLLKGESCRLVVLESDEVRELGQGDAGVGLAHQGDETFASSN